MPIEVTTSVNEDSSCKVEATIKDYDGLAISVANISTATMTLKNKSTGEVINSRTDVNVKGDINASGVFSRVLVAADNPIVDKRHSKNKMEYEVHLLILTVTATVSGSSVVLNESIAIKVLNIMHF